jgi:hypothetical protein
MKRPLLHSKLPVRFLSLYVLSTAIFLMAWTMSYYTLPEGILRGRTGAQLLAGNEPADSFLLEWLRIAAINLAAGTLFVIGPNLLRSHGYPMGYATPLAWAILYGIYLGTNSFTFPLPEGRMPPSLAVLLRSGPYEIAAYVLAAVSTYSLPRFELKGRFFHERLVAISPPSRKAFSKEQWLGLAAAVMILLLANGYEADRIMAQSST